ncbi:MAG: amidohydrolase [Nakamurella sp.]
MIRTLDDDFGTVSALAVRGERIIAAGSAEECVTAAGPGARHVDLGGATVIPGLTDSHIHTSMYARDLVSVDLRKTKSLDIALDLIRTHAATLEPGAWLLGGRWDSNRWDVPVLPDRRSLDHAVPDRPAWLPTIDGHTAWVNSAALRALGIDRTTPNPPGGRIDRDADGEPTGIMRETATHLLDELIADVTVLQPLLRSALDRLLSHGLTSIHGIDGLEALHAFQALRKAGDLPIRVHKLIRHADLTDAIDSGLATGDGDSWIRTGPVKLFTDGAVGSHSCFMSHDFADEPGNHGHAVTALPELRDLVHNSHNAGIAIAAHAIGDRANHDLIDAFAEVLSGHHEHRLRYRIEHAQYLQHSDVKRIARLGIIASMQPKHCTATRLHCYTTAPAFASYEEHLKGRLRPGMMADFAVLADDPFSMDPSELHQVKVHSTFVGGEVRWCS